MPTLASRIAALALIVALCAIRCTCGCMSDSLGAYLGHVAATSHDCCHACDESDDTPGTPVHHDSSCAADERIPSPNSPQLDWPLAVAVLIEFPSPTDVVAPSPRSIGTAENPPALADRSLLRLHCALIV